MVRVGHRLVCHHRNREFNSGVRDFLKFIILAILTELGYGILQDWTSSFPLRREASRFEGNELKRLDTATETNLVKHYEQFLSDVSADITRTI